MAGQKIKFRLEGSVTLDEFQAAVAEFHRLLSALAEQVRPDAKIEWKISDLQGGSVAWECDPMVDDPEEQAVADEVADRYGFVARIAAERDWDGWATLPRAVRDPAAALTMRVGVTHPVAIMSSNGNAFQITEPMPAQPPSELRASTPRASERTSVRGRIVTLDQKRSTYFTLQEAHTNRNFRCYPNAELRTVISDLWKSKEWVLVEGTLNRFTFSPTLVDITRIKPLGTAPADGWKMAFGVLAGLVTPGSAGDTLRRWRDAE